MNALNPIYNLPIQYKQGGVITSDGSTAVLSISAVLCRSSQDDLDINVGDYFGAASATSVNGAVNGLNGLDTGNLAASTVYAVYAVADSSGYNPSGYLLSLSATSPVLPSGNFPSGYSSFARIGWAVTNSSTHFSKLYISGNGNNVTYTYDVPVKVLNAGVATTQTAIDLSAVVPPVAGIPLDVYVNLLPGSGGAGDSAAICYSGATLSSSTDIIIGQVQAVNIAQQIQVPAALISGKAKIDYAVSNARSAVSVWVTGFTDILV